MSPSTHAPRDGSVRGVGRPGELVLAERGDRKRALVLVRGYLHRQRGKQRERWLSAIRGAGFRGDVFEFAWDASSPLRFATNVWRYRDWHAATRRARRMGRYRLPEVLANLRYAHVDVAGASAGGAVVFHALSSPLLQPGCVRSAWLLGAAMPREASRIEWNAALSCVTGNVHNVYCPNDLVLSSVFAAATGGREACGTGPIPFEDGRLHNWDASEWIGGSQRSLASHNNYSLALGRLLERETKSG
jgi:hypothetical protein